MSEENRIKLDVTVPINRVQKTAAPKLSTNDVKMIHFWSVSDEVDVEAITLTRSDAESLTQEVLDARTAENLNDALLKRYEKLVEVFENSLRPQHAFDCLDPYRERMIACWLEAKKELTR